MLKLLLFLVSVQFIWITGYASIMLPGTFRSGSPADKKDSLKTLIEQKSDDISKVNLLNDLGKQLLDENPESAIEFILSAEELASKLHYKKGFLAASHTKARYYYTISQYENAVKQSVKSAEMAEKEKDTTTIILSRNLLASVYGRMNNYPKALEIYEELQQIIEKSGDVKDKLMLYNNLGNIYGFMGNLPEAEKYFTKCFHSVGTSPKESGLLLYKGSSANNLSFLNVFRDNGPEAIKWANIAIQLAEEMNNNELLLECLTNLGNGYYKNGDFDKAIQTGQRVIDLAKKNNALLQQQNGYGNMYLYYEGKGDFKTALNYYKKYSELKDTIFNNNMMKQITELETKYQTEKKNREITQKEEELRIASIKLDYTITVLIIVGALLILIIFLYLNVKRAFNALVKKNYELSRIETHTPVIISKNFSAGKESVSLLTLNDNSEKYTSSSLGDEKKEELYSRILKLLNDDKLFLQKGITIEKFASILDVNSKYISQAINEKFNGGFSSLINEYRIREAIKLLSDDQYSNYSLEGIAESVGFNSKSVFNSTFKKITGLTPSYYRNNIEIAKGA